MLTFNIKIRTKLGSIRSKSIAAPSEEEALNQAKLAFPLHEKIWIEGDAQETPTQSKPNAETNDRISEMKRNSELAKAKARRTEGLIWLTVGTLLTISTFLFVRNAFIIAFGPIIWGGFIYKKADNRIKNLTEDQTAGLPFIER